MRIVRDQESASVGADEDQEKVTLLEVQVPDTVILQTLTVLHSKMMLNSFQLEIQ